MNGPGCRADPASRGRDLSATRGPARTAAGLPVLDGFVEDCLRDGVALVCVVGDGCELVEDAIDELVVGDGSDPSRSLVTTSHPGATSEQVMAFAAA